MFVICIWIQSSSRLCAASGNPRTAPEDVMELGRRNVRHLDQWDTKGQEQAFYAPGEITGLEGRAGVQEYVQSPFFLRKNCLLYLPKRWIIAGEEAGKRR